MILPSINKQASNAHTQTQLPALPYNLIVAEPSSVSRTINRTSTPVPLSPAGLCSFHYTVQAALQVATVPAPNPPTPDPPPFVTYRKEKSQTRCLWYRSCFSLTANRLNGEKIYIFFASSASQIVSYVSSLEFQKRQHLKLCSKLLSGRQTQLFLTKFFHIQIFLSSYKHYFLFCLEIWDKVVRVQKQQEEILSDAVSVTLTYKNRNTHSSKYIQALYCVIQFELPNILQLFTCYQCFCLKWKSKLVSWHLCTWVHILDANSYQ